MAENLDFAQYLHLIEELVSKQTISDLESMKVLIAQIANRKQDDPIGYQLASQLFFRMIHNHQHNVPTSNFPLFYELSKVFHLNDDCQQNPYNRNHQQLISEETEKLTTYLQRYCSLTKSGLICQIKSSLKEDLIDQGNQGQISTEFDLSSDEYGRLYQELISYLDGPSLSLTKSQ